MALAGASQAPSPRPNAMGQALMQGAENIGNSMYQAAQIKNQQDTQIATMTMQMLPGLANNPEALARFTSNKEFSRVAGAMQRVGYGSFLQFDPVTNGYKVNMSATAKSVDDLAGESIQQLATRNGVVDPRRAYGLTRKYKQSSTAQDPYLTSYNRARGRAVAEEENPSDIDLAKIDEIKANKSKREAEVLEVEARTNLARELMPKPKKK